MTTTEREPAARQLDRDLAALASWADEVARTADAAAAMTPVEHAGAIATVQDTIARLREVEKDLAIALGAREGATQGELPDGRLFRLERARDRTGWDHDDWKRDVRRAIVDEFTRPGDSSYQGVVTAAGEVVPLGPVLQEAITVAQNVHGSTAPKSTALKALGLWASDYCTTSPGGWRFTATPKSTTETVQEN